MVTFLWACLGLYLFVTWLTGGLLVPVLATIGIVVLIAIAPSVPEHTVLIIIIAMVIVWAPAAIKWNFVAPTSWFQIERRAKGERS
ncbi:MAG: hypothetical protein ACREFP_14175 [Acetobacteraceae bacterium]